MFDAYVEDVLVQRIWRPEIHNRSQNDDCSRNGFLAVSHEHSWTSWVAQFMVGVKKLTMSFSSASRQFCQAVGSWNARQKSLSNQYLPAAPQSCFDRGTFCRICSNSEAIHPGWWYTYPSGKYESQLGWFMRIYEQNMFQTTNQHPHQWCKTGQNLPCRTQHW